MSVRWSKVGKAITVDDLARAEKTLGLPITEQFREFLLQTNGGVPNPKKVVGHSFSVTYILNLAEVLRVARQYWDELNLPKHQLPIGFADEVDLLVLDGDKVVIHTNCEGGIGMFGAGCEDVASSLNEFLGMLQKGKRAGPSNEAKFVDACELGELKKVRKMLAEGVDWKKVAAPAFAAAFQQMKNWISDYTLLTMLFEGGAPRDVQGIFDNSDASMPIEDFIRKRVIPNEKQALGSYEEGTKKSDQARAALAQLESILKNYYGG